MRSLSHCALVLIMLGAGLGHSLYAQALAGNDSTLAHCDKPMGNVVIVEPSATELAMLSRSNLQSPTSLIDNMVGRSNCFTVLHRGAEYEAMIRERAISSSGQGQSGSNMGNGQMEVADFLLTPHLTNADAKAGGAGGAIGSLIGHSILGGVAGGVNTSTANTSMTMTDARTSRQVAQAEGDAKKHSFSIGALGLAGGALGGVGGYSSTNEGKVIAASLANNFNKLVADVLANPALQHLEAAPGVLGKDVKAGFMAGDVLALSIDNVSMTVEPNSTSKVVAMLKKADGVVYLGEEKDGYLHVQAGVGEGWVKKVLLTKPR